ncbi:MAG: hypothetical protein PQJ49_03515 [Sphaerochaetaceae bacterium]|nr:hypothetical protein [Sphaerochaetaceae bacterium]
MKKVFIFLMIFIVFLTSSCVIVRPDAKPEKVVVVEHHLKQIKAPHR